MYNFDKPYNRKGTNCTKWDISDDEQMLPMWIADMDFACCDKILDGIKARVDQLTLGYENPVTAEYLLAVTGWFDQRHHWAVEPQWVVPTSGAVEALGIAIKALTEPGEGVIVQRPVYGPFDATIKSCGRQVVNNKLLYENGASFSTAWGQAMFRRTKPWPSGPKWVPGSGTTPASSTKRRQIS